MVMRKAVAHRAIVTSFGASSDRRRNHSSSTQLGAYLKKAGATWGDAAEVHDVVVSDAGRTVSWRVDLPSERLDVLYKGALLESPPFPLGKDGKSTGRIQLFPKGDADSAGDGMCSLWLWTDLPEQRPVQLRLGSVDRAGGSSEFCRLEDVLQDGVLDVGLCMPEDSSTAEAAETIVVQQSLQMTDLQAAEWRVWGIADLLRRPASAGIESNLVSSPPFRFHHVLLGDMYLELLPGVPHAEHCLVFFRSRVPTMKLQVELTVGDAFSKSYVSLGRTNVDEDIKQGSFLQVNLDASGVLAPDGSILVRCALEKVVQIPANLRELIPKLDERASWPKRL